MSFLNKSTKTSIMYGVIICLLVGIVVCIARISVRPKIDKGDEFNLSGNVSLDDIDVDGVDVAEPVREEVHIEVHDRARILEDNINVRSGPGTDYDRLGTAYKGFDFEILSKDNSEWIKIKYDEKEAYIYSKYVEIVPMFLNDMGEYEEYVELDDNASNSTGAKENEETSENAETDGNEASGETSED